MMYDTPHAARNLASFNDVNWGPPFDHSKSGTDVRQKWSLNAAMSLGAVVFLPMSISGQLVLQSTTMRNCRPPCDPKSIATC